MSRMTTKYIASKMGKSEQHHHNHTGDSLELLTGIDPSMIRIPSIGSLTARPIRVEAPMIQPDRDGNGDVTIEIHKSEAMPQASLTVPGWIVPVSVLFFGIVLALSNLLKPAYTGTMCLATSPSGIIAISAHAFASSTSATVALGLFSAAWLLPLTCSELLWSSSYVLLAQIYVLWLSIWIFISLRNSERVVACVPFIFLACSAVTTVGLTYYPEKLNPRWPVTISCFLCFFICVYATRNSFRYNYTIKPLL
jgi:hypothetical protein